MMTELQKFLNLEYALNLFNDPQGMVLILIIGTVVLVSVLLVVFLLSSESKRISDRKKLNKKINVLNKKLVQSDAVLSSDEQLIFIWADQTTMLQNQKISADSVQVLGGLPNVVGLPKTAQTMLDFTLWIDESAVEKAQKALMELATNGTAFAFFIKTRAIERVEMLGHVVGKEIVFRIRDLKEDRLFLARGNEKWANLENKVEQFDVLLSNSPFASWLRDDSGKLVWVNKAYVQAVEAEDGGSVVQESIELIAPADVYKARQYFADEKTKIDLAGANADNIVKNITEHEDKNFIAIEDDLIEQQVFAVIKGVRCHLKIRHQKIDGAIISTAYDTTEFEEVKDELKRYNQAHKQTLDKLKTGIVQFGPDQNLEFYNSAYQELFGMESEFLNSKPSMSAVLEQVRNLKKMPEQANFKTWRDTQLEAFRQVKASEKWWHLPNGTALHIIADPHSFGGVTFLYDDVTEHMALASKYKELDQTQSETLDNLTDGVAVFGANGELQISNPAFAKIWHFKPDVLVGKPHVNVVLDWCKTQSPDGNVWDDLKTSVTAIVDERMTQTGTINCNDGAIVEYAAIPLPNSSTLMTFTDVTIMAKASNLLKERNQALTAADDLKTEFISHMSYQFREPLTNILGFSEMLEGQLFGDLNEKQKEYVDIIRSSSFGLRTLINDILDLASLGADRLELQYGDVEINELIGSAIASVDMPASQKNIVLNRIIMPSVGTFEGDGERILQVLYNLLSNAIQYSDKDGIVSIGAEKENEYIRLWVRDAGVGIDKDKLKSVFDEFQSDRANGAGLGLSLVKKLVEFHGGEVKILSEIGKGTIVSCYLPLKKKPREKVAQVAEATIPMAEAIIPMKLGLVKNPVVETKIEQVAAKVEVAETPKAQIEPPQQAKIIPLRTEFAPVDLKAIDDDEPHKDAFDKATDDIGKVNEKLEKISKIAGQSKKPSMLEQLKLLRRKKIQKAVDETDDLAVSQDKPEQEAEIATDEVEDEREVEMGSEAVKPLELDAVIMPKFETDSRIETDTGIETGVETTLIAVVDEPDEAEQDTDITDEIKAVIDTADPDAESVAEAIAEIVKKDEDSLADGSIVKLKVRKESKAIFATATATSSPVEPSLTENAEPTEEGVTGLKVRKESKAVFADSRLAALYQRRRLDETSPPDDAKNDNIQDDDAQKDDDE